MTAVSCTFCNLAMFSKYIFAEDERFYFVATPGQITDGGYALIIPKRHVRCLGALEEQEIPLLEKAIDRCATALSREYGESVTIFEHGVVGQTIPHAHLHLAPVKYDFSAQLARDFPYNGVANLANWNDLRIAYGKSDMPYLLSQHNTKGLYVCWNPNAQPQYLRIVLANALGRPERANWRTMEPEIDKRLVQKTISRLKLYFS